MRLDFYTYFVVCCSVLAAFRGFETTIETPESKNSERIYEFSDDKLKIYIDGDMTTEMGYEVQFWGVETGSNNPPLAVRYEDGGLSMLVINSKGECMGLINSFNDAGGDSCFEKIDSGS